MWHRLRDCRGQGVVLALLGFWIFVAFAAISIDTGLMINSRRHAQSAVDNAALAGAMELSLSPSSAAADTLAAAGKALEWAQKNGIDTSEPGLTLSVQVVSTCFSDADVVPTGVTVSLQRDPTTFLIGALGVTGWHVSATATACAGHPSQGVAFLPIALSASSDCYEADGQGGRRPVAGRLCDIYVNNDSSSSNLTGQLTISPTGPTCSNTGSGANDIYVNIVNGAQVLCSIGDSVYAKTGFDLAKIRNGIIDRLHPSDASLPQDGDCEKNFASAGGTTANFNSGNAALVAPTKTNVGLHSTSRTDSMDDFYEIWGYNSTASHPATGLVPYHCNPEAQMSPRIVTLITISNYGVEDCGGKCYIIRGFARAYLEGCTVDNVFRKGCNWPGGAGGGYTINVRLVEEHLLSAMDLNLQSSYGGIGVFLKR